MDLLEQAARHITQCLGLRREHADRFRGLRSHLIGGLLDHDRVVGKQLVKVRRLPAEGHLDGAGMLGEHAIDLAGALAEGIVDGLQAFGE